MTFTPSETLVIRSLLLSEVWKECEVAISQEDVAIGIRAVAAIKESGAPETAALVMGESPRLLLTWYRVVSRYYALKGKAK